MRVVQPGQFQLGEQAIADIQFDMRSRGDMTQLLMGLQHLYTTPDLRSAVFHLLETHIQPQVDKTGSSGKFVGKS